MYTYAGSSSSSSAPYWQTAARKAVHTELYYSHGGFFAYSSALMGLVSAMERDL